MLREVHLHGALGQKFGRRHCLDVATPAEAVRALMTQLPGFRQAIVEGTWRVVRGRERAVRAGEALDAEALTLRLGAARHLHILPAGKGRGGRNGGVAKIIVGIVMVAAAIWTAGASLAGSFGAGGAVSTGAMTSGQAVSAALSTSVIGVQGVLSASTVGLMGLAMIMGGVTMLLSPQVPNRHDVDQKASFLLSGPTNTGTQGLPVPLVYGQCRVGSVVAAAAVRNDAYTPPPAQQVADKTGVLGVWADSIGSMGG